MKILFMCVANSARSQMAEGLARVTLGEMALVFSAGSQPSFVNPMAIQVLKEIGIDISKHASKRVEDISESSFDCVVTLCAEEVCPIYLGTATKLHWPFPDPASVEGEAPRLEAFRKVRDGIKQKLEEYKGSLK